MIRRRRDGKPYDPARLHPIKLRAIDAAFAEAGARTVADLGGVWAVDGGYTFYALAEQAAERAVLVDDDFTPAVEANARRYPQLELVRMNFGLAAAAERVGSVDALLLFDVLLHQVRPDWDEVLELYAPRTRAFVIVQPAYVGERTERLIDLGVEAYLRLVPAVGIHQEAVTKLEEMNEQRGRLWRDVHDIWQWGIRDEDLVDRLAGLGFERIYFENEGPWRGLERFENHASVFART